MVKKGTKREKHLRGKKDRPNLERCNQKTISGSRAEVWRYLMVTWPELVTFGELPNLLFCKLPE